jgi:hypothetical protein
MKLFALVESEGRIIGYGFTLPDGSAVSVAWPVRSGAALFSSRSAEQSALLRGADLIWMTDKEPS